VVTCGLVNLVVRASLFLYDIAISIKATRSLLRVLPCETRYYWKFVQHVAQRHLRGDFFKSGTRGGGCDKFRKNQILSMYVCRATIQYSKNVKVIILGLFPDFWEFFF
jgi:hypothetical protein